MNTEQYYTLFVIRRPDGIGRMFNTLTVEPDAPSMILRRALADVLRHFPEYGYRFVKFSLQDNPDKDTDKDIYEARDPDGHFVMYMSKTLLSVATAKSF